MERSKDVIQQVRDFVNGLPETRVSEADSWPDQGFLYPVYIYMLSQRGRVLDWSLERICQDSLESKLCGQLGPIEIDAGVRNMVEELDERGIIEYLDYGDVKPEIPESKRLFRFNSDNASLAHAYDYCSHLAELYGADSREVQEFSILADIYGRIAESEAAGGD